MPVWIPQCHITFPDFEYLISAWTPPHASCACKDCRENTTIIPQNFILGLPCFTLSSHSSSPFLSLAHPTTWQGYTELPAWAESLSFRWISPSRKTNKTKAATKAKQIRKQISPSTLASQVHPLGPVHLILAISYNLCGPTDLKSARLVLKEGFHTWQMSGDGLKGLVWIANIHD